MPSSIPSSNSRSNFGQSMMPPLAKAKRQIGIPKPLLQMASFCFSRFGQYGLKPYRACQSLIGLSVGLQTAAVLAILAFNLLHSGSAFSVISDPHSHAATLLTRQLQEMMRDRLSNSLSLAALGTAGLIGLIGFHLYYECSRVQNCQAAGQSFRGSWVWRSLRHPLAASLGSFSLMLHAGLALFWMSADLSGASLIFGPLSLIELGWLGLHSICDSLSLAGLDLATVLISVIAYQERHQRSDPAKAV